MKTSSAAAMCSCFERHEVSTARLRHEATQALEEAKTRDRLYIPSRYQLFTLNQVRQVSCCSCSHHAAGSTGMLNAD